MPVRMEDVVKQHSPNVSTICEQVDDVLSNPDRAHDAKTHDKYIIPFNLAKFETLMPDDKAKVEELYLEAGWVKVEVIEAHEDYVNHVALYFSDT